MNGYLSSEPTKAAENQKNKQTKKNIYSHTSLQGKTQVCEVLMKLGKENTDLDVLLGHKILY